jgi:hypothetical protein
MACPDGRTAQRVMWKLNTFGSMGNGVPGRGVPGFGQD